MEIVLKKNRLIILLSIICIAFILRFYQLGQNPPSLDWDEASLGYNAYSILKTGADEYGNKFPSSFRSFDDYKPPLYVYLSVPSVYVFGLNEFSTRFISAFFGFLTVILTYFLVKTLLKPVNNVNDIALLSSFLLAISPWHIQFSRAAFEANVGLFFFVGGVLFFLKAIHNGKLFLLSFFLFSLSLYSYHSTRLVIPLFLLGLSLYLRNKLWLQRKYFLLAFIFLLILCIPLFKSFLSEKSGASRLSSVTILKPTGTLDHSITEIQLDKKNGDKIGEILHNRRIVYFLAITKGYLDHLNPDFLFIHGDGVMRHHPVDFGMLYLFELPFIIFGIHLLLQEKIDGRFIIFWWFLVAPIASAISSGTPHPVRALLYLPTFQIFTSIGIFRFFKASSSIKFKHLAYVLFVSLFSLNFIYYLHQYYVHTPVEYSSGWQYGYREVFKELAVLEPKYKKIIVTYKYDQPYILYLFYNKIDPSWYQKNWDFLKNGSVERDSRIIGKYEFRNINWNEDRKLDKTIIVGTSGEIPSNVSSTQEVKFLDGSIAFKIVAR